MRQRDRIADFWDRALVGWRADPEGMDLPEELKRWLGAYRGSVDLSGYPEGFLGDLRGEQNEPQMVVLGLNPGACYPTLQGPNGAWTRKVRELGYSRSSMHRVPHRNIAWKDLHNGRDSRYWANLVRFARKWLGDTEAGPEDILNFEMFPFHSKNLNSAISPPSDLIETFIWEPFLELRPKIAFAFGKDWVPVCARLLGEPIAAYGPDLRLLADVTKGDWRVNVHRIRNKRVIVSWQKGYAGPPVRNLDELRRIVEVTSDYHAD